MLSSLLLAAVLLTALPRGLVNTTHAFAGYAGLGPLVARGGCSAAVRMAAVASPSEALAKAEDAPDADPFARVVTALRKTKLESVSSILNGDVDIASVPLRRSVPGAAGALEEPIEAERLWSQGGALIVAVRRPG